jgi:NAD(P)H dehydrogenase (quinone)
MTTPTLLVTGASGQLGRRVVEMLLERNEGPIVATTRTPETLLDFKKRGVDVRAADFEDEASLVNAFSGADRALLISTDALGKRLPQHAGAIRAFETVGVKHVVYTSLPNADKSLVSIASEHAGTEAAVAATKLDFTILRNNLYLDLALLTLKRAVAAGQIVDARGSGAVAFVTREDCARTAAAALADHSTNGRRISDVTGPEAITSDQLAAMVSEIVGRKVAHVSVPVDVLVSGIVERGVPRPMAEIIGSFDLAVSKGELANATETVAALTGRPPQSAKDFLTANRAALS